MAVSVFFFFSSRRRHTRWPRDWSSDVCSSDLTLDQSNEAIIDMTLTSAACPLTDVIEDQTAEALEGITNGVRINWVWMPPWGPDKITDDGREQLRALGFNV